jgi:RNA polymerase sigma-70 factor (ECF subfamily)
VRGELTDDVGADEVTNVETRALVHGLVDRLPADHRAVITLRFGEDLSIADVAMRLGRSPDAVKQLQRRALATLRTLLAEGDDDA